MRTLLGKILIFLAYGSFALSAADTVTIQWENIGSATAWDSEIVIQGGSVVLSASHRIAGSSGSFIVPYVSGRKYIARWRSAISGGTLISNDPIEGCANCTIELVFNGGGGPVAPTPDPWKWKGCFKNTTPYMRMVRAWVDGVAVGTAFPVAPDQEHCFEFAFDEKKIIEIRSDIYDSTGTISGQSVGVIGLDDDGWEQTDGTPTAQERDFDNMPLPKDTQSKDDNSIEFDTTQEDLARDESVRTGLGAVHRAVATGLDSINNNLRLGNNKLDGLTAAVNSGFVAVDGRLVTANSYLSSVDTKMTTLNTTIGSVNSSVSGLGGKLDTGNAKLTDLQGGLGTLNNTQTAIKNAIDTYINDQGELAVDARTFWAAVEGKLPTVGRLFSSEDGEEVEGAIMQVKQSIENQNPITSVNAVKDAVIAFREQQDHDMSVHSGKLDDIEAAINAHKAEAHTDSAAVKNAVDAHKTQAHTDSQALGNKLDDVNETLGEISDKLDDEPDMPNDLAALVAANYAEAEAAAYAVKGEDMAGVNAIGGALSTAGNMSPGPSETFWVIEAAGHTFDFNPMHQPLIASFMGWNRTIATFFITIFFMYACWAVFAEEGRFIGASNQATAELDGPYGTTGVVISKLTAIAITGGCIATFYALWVDFKAEHNFLTIFGSQPLLTSNPAIAGGIWFLDQLFPVQLAMTYITAYIIWSMTAHYQLRAIQAIIRRMS